MQIDIDFNLLESLLSLATVIEARDEYTGGHTWRVSKYAEILANAYGLNTDEIFVVKVGGLVHDIGKVGIPDAILNKPGPLDHDEFESMKKHPLIGNTVIERHPLAPLVRTAVYNHHERIDGKGYPQGNVNLSIYSKIISIADAFDAMTSSRPYRPGMQLEKAIKIIQENAGTQFDTALAQVFISLAHTGKLTHILGHANEAHTMQSCTECGPIIAVPSNINNGDHIACPHCHGDYVVHIDTHGINIEWTKKSLTAREITPDKDAVQSVLSSAKKTIKL